MTKLRKRFLILGLLIVLALAVGVALVLYARATGPSHEEGATHAIAQAYMAAVMEGDKRAAMRLYRADAVCSGVDPWKTVDAHIDVHSADGTGYPPGSEGADIRFSYKPEGMPWWRSGAIWVVTGPPDADGKRFICHLGGG